MTIKIPVSAGELIDKITILEIKAIHIKEREKLQQVKSELNMLNKEYSKIENKCSDKRIQLDKLKNHLHTINSILWETEDKIRMKESKKTFDQEFIKLARSIYTKNDTRALIKNKINHILGSKLSDIKHYKKY